jgi:hypothetical protein
LNDFENNVSGSTKRRRHVTGNEELAIFGTLRFTTSGLAVFDYESRLTQDLPFKQQKKDGR